MGYDMYWKQEPDEVKAAYAAAFPADGGWDQERVGEWSELRDKVGSYFRLNVWGMGRYMGYMAERGMLADAPHPRYPEHSEFGVSDEESQRDPERAAEMSAAYRQWRDAVSHWTDDDTGGPIPAYKFSSNDGWLLTPTEITKSLEALRAWEDAQRRQHGSDWVDPLRSEDDGYWDRWIRFLYCARSHGGVVVR